MAHPFLGYIGGLISDVIVDNEASRLKRAAAALLGGTAMNFSAEVTQSVAENPGSFFDFVQTHNARMETAKDFAFAVAGWGLLQWQNHRMASDRAD